MILLKKIVFFATMATLFATVSYGGNMSESEMLKEGRRVFVTKKLGNCLGCHEVHGDSSIPQTGSLGPKLV